MPDCPNCTRLEADLDAAHLRLGALGLKPNLSPDLVKLIANLGSMYSHRGDGIPTQPVNPHGEEAAAAIEGLVARCAALEAGLA